MCGIFGAHGNPVGNATQTLKLLQHRGPDGQAVAYQENAYLGHTRLAIVDVEGGQQPLSDAAGLRWLICNGEIYNHPQLRAQYPDYPYKTRSDSEDILAIYEQHHAATPQHLHGMFAFALLDENEIFIARDPLGIKPLYYGHSGATLLFASEIKALQDEVDQVNEFPPGHWYSSSQGLNQYYDLHRVVQDASKPENHIHDPATIREQLQKVVESHLMTDVPLGVFLSGGLDSSIISALVKQGFPHLHSFAVGMEGGEDLIYARQMAKALATTHHEYIYTAQEMQTILPDVIYYLESFDPALVRSAIANYFLARLASEYVTVILSGEGADELFSGYQYLKAIRGKAALHRELVEITAELHNRNLQRLDRMTMAHGLEGRVPFLDSDFVELAFRVPIEQKLYGDQQVEKWALRQAFADMLPQEIVWRSKEKFAKGAGSAHIFEQIAADEIDDAQFMLETQQVMTETGHRIKSKEELYYYRIFRAVFKAPITRLVGSSRSL